MRKIYIKKIDKHRQSFITFTAIIFGDISIKLDVFQIEAKSLYIILL